MASLQAPTAGEHIQPLWISQSRDSAMQQIDCEVDTGAGCNILTLYMAWEIFKQEWLSLDQPTVYIQAFGGQIVRNLGSCVVYMHTKGKIYKVSCEVTDTQVYLSLAGNKQRAWAMEDTHKSSYQPV